MSYSLPSYITAANSESLALPFKWDDTRPKDFYLHGSDEVLEKLATVTLRAKFAAAIGIYEWIICRFRPLSDDSIPFHVAEAAWCAAIHPTYMRYFELDRRKWIGPVRGPLWCAATILSSMFFYCTEDEEPAAKVAFLSSLALHVLSKPKDFEKWRDTCIDRLLALYPVSHPDPFEHLFDLDLGPLLSREVLEPSFDYRPEKAKASIAAYLQGVHYKQNPFLNSPEEMKQEGFEGTPYVI